MKPKSLFTSIISTFIVLMLFSNSIAKVNAKEETNYKPKNSISSESPMPLVIGASLTSISKSSTTYSSRRLWMDLTKLELEKSYSKKVIVIVESNTAISFYFDSSGVEYFPPTNEEQQIEVGQVVTDVTSSGVYAVDYMKPEVVFSKTNGTMAATTLYSTKIERAYSYSTSFINLDTKFANNYTNAITIAILFLPGVYGYVAGVVTYIAAHAISYIDYNIKIKGKTMVQYYYQNKIGYVWNTATSTWQAWSQIGSRRSFKKQETWNVHTDNSVYNYSAYFNAAQAPTSNPSNYDGNINMKPNFENDSYIIQKAVEGFESGLPYVDIYGLATIFM